MSASYPCTNVPYLTGMIAGLLALLSCVNALQGQDLAQVLHNIDAQTSVLVRIDPAALDALIDAAKQSGKDSEQTVLHFRLKQTREILGNDPIWLTIGFPKTPLKVQILVGDAERIEKLKDLWDFTERSAYGPHPQVVIRQLTDSDQRGTGNSARLDQWKKLMAPSKDTKPKAGTIQFGCLPPANLYDTYRELLTDLPDYLGGGPVTVLTDGLQSVSGTLDLKTGALEGTIDSASPEAASAFADQATQSLAKFNASQFLSWMQNGLDRSPDELVAVIRALLQRSTFKPVESQVRWQIEAGEDWIPKKVLELVVGPQSNRSATKRLRDLALGILNYESANQSFPPPREANKPNGLSWRVHILPYLDINEANELYQKFALDEPWDSPTNIKLLPLMPSIYSDYGSKLLAPASAKPGYTTVVAPISENTTLGAPKKVTFGSITDGTSNTILLVIVKDSLAVPWTATQDYVFDPNQPASGLQFTDGKVPVVFCDGSTELLGKDNDAETWAGTFEMNEGGIVRPK